MTATRITAVLRRPDNLPQGIRASHCWYITFGLGTAAGKTFTRVQFADDFTDADGAPYPEHVLHAVVRQVAAELYGTAWAFNYRPDEYQGAIGRFDMRIREHVDITELEVW